MSGESAALEPRLKRDLELVGVQLRPLIAERHPIPPIDLRLDPAGERGDSRGAPSKVRIAVKQAVQGMLVPEIERQIGEGVTRELSWSARSLLGCRHVRSRRPRPGQMVREAPPRSQQFEAQDRGRALWNDRILDMSSYSTCLPVSQARSRPARRPQSGGIRRLDACSLGSTAIGGMEVASYRRRHLAQLAVETLGIHVGAKCF